VEEFLDEWSEVSFEQVNIDQKLGGEGELSRVAFVLDECILSRSMILSLAQVVGSVVNLVLEPRYWNASFGWSDWVSKRPFLSPSSIAEEEEEIQSC